MAGFLKVLFRNLLEGPSTDPFPLGETFTPDRLRGRVKIDPNRCVGCGICVHYCVSDAIHIDRREDGHTITIWENLCCRCATCRQFCPTKAISLIPDWHSTHLEEDKYKKIEQQVIKYEPCLNCGTLMRPVPVPVLEKLYVNNGDVELEHVRHLCPACRQLEDAKRNAGVLEASSTKAVE